MSLSHAGLIAQFEQLAWDRGLYVHCCGDGRRCEGPGLPDLIIAGPRGVIFREVKSAAAPALRDDQKAWLRMLGLGKRGDLPPVARVWRQDDLDSRDAERELDRLRDDWLTPPKTIRAR